MSENVLRRKPVAEVGDKAFADRRRITELERELKRERLKYTSALRRMQSRLKTISDEIELAIAMAEEAIDKEEERESA